MARRDKRNLGGNALLAVSLATAHAAAAARRVPLYRHLADLFRQIDSGAPPPRMPLPMVNMISGGLHAGGNLDFQDFLIMPGGAAQLCRRAGMDHPQSTAGWAAAGGGRLRRPAGRRRRGLRPAAEEQRRGARFLVRAIEAAGLRPGRDVTMALDVASTHFYDGRTTG